MLPLPCLSLVLWLVWEKFWEGQGHNETLRWDRVLNIQKCCPRASWERRDKDAVGTDGDFPDTCTVSCFAQVLHSTLANSPCTCYMSYWHQWRLPSWPYMQQNLPVTTLHCSNGNHIQIKRRLFPVLCSGFPSILWVYTQFFGSTQYSCCLTACLCWQKIQLKLFKILSEIIRTGIKVTTREIFWNLVVPRKKEKEKRKNEAFPVYKTQKMIIKTFCA